MNAAKDVNNLNFEQHLGLVDIGIRHARAKLPYSMYSNHYDDILQCVYIALYIASRRYDESKGTAFSTYAVKYIIGYINIYLERVYRSRRKDWRIPLSLDRPIDIDDYGDPIYIADFVQAPDDKHICWVLTDTRLSDEQREMCRLLLEGYTQMELSDVYKVSQPTIARRFKAIGRLLQGD